MHNWVNEPVGSSCWPQWWTETTYPSLCGSHWPKPGENAFDSIKSVFLGRWLYCQVFNNILRAVYTPFAWLRALVREEEIRMQWTGKESDKANHVVGRGECRVCCLRVCLWFHRVFTLNCCYYWFLICATCKLFYIVSFDLFLLVDSLLFGVLCLLLESLLWRPVESQTLLESLVDISGWVLSLMKWINGV